MRSKFVLTSAIPLAALLFIVFSVKAEAQKIFSDGFESGLLSALNFVVTWQNDLDDADETQIFARGFDQRFSDTLVSDLVPGVQTSPAIAVAADGSFVVTWEDDTDKNGLYQIHARGFHADGSERLPRFTVNSVGAGQQRHPDIAMAPNGDFVVVWEDDQDNNGLYNMRGRGFYANGAQRFDDQNVANSGSGSELTPVIGMADDGSFVVAWADDTDYNGTFQIHARGFHANGSERFGSFTVNSKGAGEQREPDISVAPNGDFVVVWADDQDTNWFYQVLARGFFANGSQRFADKTLNQVATASQYRPAVAIAEDGSFAAAWVDQGHRITSRQFDALGSALTDDTVLNSNGLQLQFRPAVDATADGEYLVVWQFLADDGYYGLNGRRLDAEGNKGPEFALSSDSAGDQMVPAVSIR